VLDRVKEVARALFPTTWPELLIPAPRLDLHCPKIRVPRLSSESITLLASVRKAYEPPVPRHVAKEERGARHSSICPASLMPTQS